MEWVRLSCLLRVMNQRGCADESRDATPSFALLDVQGPVIVTYVYQLVDGEVCSSPISRPTPRCLWACRSPQLPVMTLHYCFSLIVLGTVTAYSSLLVIRRRAHSVSVTPTPTALHTAICLSTLHTPLRRVHLPPRTPLTEPTLTLQVRVDKVEYRRPDPPKDQTTPIPKPEIPAGW